jgi:hypothetical protein
MFRKRITVYKKMGYTIKFEENSQLSKMTLRKKEQPRIIDE